MNWQTVEKRQRARIAWRFWVAVEGSDDYPRLRNGNISLNGVFFEIDRSVGTPGAVHWVYISATEQGQPVEVMARVIRSATINDHRRGTMTVGVALEFMPEREEVRAALRALVEEIGIRQLEDREMAQEAAEAAAPISGKPLSVQDLQLETDWGLAIGETVNLEVRARQTGRQGSFAGKVVEAVPLPDGRARVRVQIVSELIAGPDEAVAKAPVPEGRGEAVGLLFADLDGQNPPTQGEQLLGSLARIQLASLLSFFELERISGVLNLGQDASQSASGRERQATVFFRDGRLVDVEPCDGTLKEVLGDLLSWSDGTFEFVMGTVDRADRVGRATSALLLELALIEDRKTRAP